MADALCGPSNALQNFQKHSQVDRSLQQDRLGLRHQAPNQSFRSTPAHPNPALDADFHAFQSGASATAPLDHLHLPLDHAAVGPSPFSPSHQPQPQQQHFHHPAPSPAAAPGWAADFQRLNLGGSAARQASPVMRHESPLQHGSPAAAGWHQEFLQQSKQGTPSPSSSYAGAGFAGGVFQPQMGFAGPSYGGFETAQPQQQQQQPQHAEMFDDAAFAEAFDMATKEMDDMQQDFEPVAVEDKGKARAEESVHRSDVEAMEDFKFDLSHACTEPGDVMGQVDENTLVSPIEEEASTLSQLHTMRRDGGWEALEAFERAHESEIQANGSQSSKEIVDAIRGMRAEEEALSGMQTEAPLQDHAVQDPTFADDPVRIGADMIPPRDLESAIHQEEQQQQPREEPNSNDGDELAATAGELLENLKHETSDKFRASSFMELMRQLRDREVRVEGEKMVSVSFSDVPVGGNEKVWSDVLPSGSY